MNTTVKSFLTQAATQNLTPTQSYANKINSKFYKSASHYVTLDVRLTTSLNDNDKILKFNNIVSALKVRFANKRWNDIDLVRAEKCVFSKIVIDTTLQREYDFKHGSRILSDFKSLLVSPIKVYEDEMQPGKYVCWDGQHTVIALYALLTKVLNEDPDKCIVPINIYPSSLKHEMRETFIEFSTTACKPLDQIDIFHQKVYAVRTDGSNDPDFLLNERKQTALESANMFATHDKFGDKTMPGALTVLTQLVDNGYTPEITEYFCKYFMAVCHSSRPVAPKESWMLYEYFTMCVNQGIDITDQYIYEVASALNKGFNGVFDADQLYSRAKISYQEWWRRNKPTYDGTLWGISYNEFPLGMTYFVAQVRKYCPSQVPVMPNPLWEIPKEDLF